MLLPQQVLFLVMRRTEGLLAGPAVQVIVCIPLWIEPMAGDREEAPGIRPSPNINEPKRAYGLHVGWPGLPVPFHLGNHLLI